MAKLDGCWPDSLEQGDADAKIGGRLFGAEAPSRCWRSTVMITLLVHALHYQAKRGRPTEEPAGRMLTFFAYRPFSCAG